MRTAFILAAASALHSVHRSSKAFLEGADGLPAPNVGHYERDPFVCFADGDSGGDGGTGGGAGDAPKTFTQEQVNAFLKREQTAIENRLRAEYDTKHKELSDKVTALTQQAEEAGKSAAEKEKLKSDRERATLEARLAELEKGKTESDAALSASRQKLRDTETGYELAGLFSKAKVLPEAMRAATLVFGADSKIEYGDDGKITGVDVGDKRFPTLAAAVEAWIKDNGAVYLPAPAGGAGSKASTGAGAPKSYANMSRADLAALVNATEPNAAQR